MKISWIVSVWCELFMRKSFVFELDLSLIHCLEIFLMSIGWWGFWNFMFFEINYGILLESYWGFDWRSFCYYFYLFVSGHVFLCWSKSICWNPLNILCLRALVIFFPLCGMLGFPSNFTFLIGWIFCEGIYFVLLPWLLSFLGLSYMHY